MTDLKAPPPLRGALPPEIESAIRLISPAITHEAYRPGEGFMHYAGGPYWGNELVA